MPHTHTEACVVEYKQRKTAAGPMLTYHDSAHGTPTALPKKWAHKPARYCAVHFAWEPSAWANTEAHR
jgi:hypothetical protein